VPSPQFLDQFPVTVVFLAFAVLTLLAYEVGFRLGRWWQARTPDETGEGPTGAIVGSVVALMAFLLAVTMSMASDRFDTRRCLVLAEANAIGTTYLRAGLLAAPADEETKALLREYVPLRIATSDRVQLQANIERSREILGEVWEIGEEAALASDQGDLMALYLDSLNEVIDLNESRVVAGVYARVPETVLILLIGGSALALGTLGYSVGLSGRRSFASALILILALGAVITLVIDLDRPQDGFLMVSQQPLLDLQQQIGP
jgi:hypothetical protein